MYLSLDIKARTNNHFFLVMMCLCFRDYVSFHCFLLPRFVFGISRLFRLRWQKVEENLKILLKITSKSCQEVLPFDFLKKVLCFQKLMQEAMFRTSYGINNFCVTRKVVSRPSYDNITTDIHCLQTDKMLLISTVFNSGWISEMLLITLKQLVLFGHLKNRRFSENGRLRREKYNLLIEFSF